MLRRHNHYCNYKYILRTFYKGSNFINESTSNGLEGGAEYDATDMPLKPVFCLAALLRQMRSAKFFFLVTCISFTFSFIWIQLGNRSENPPVTESLIRQDLANVGEDSNVNSHLSKNLKYLLLWTRQDYAPFYFFETGQSGFLNNKCSVVNCYVTGNRQFFGGNLTRFHAIAFNGRNLDPYDLPHNRSAHQKYIFVNMESADNYPVCAKSFDGFFNWTATYRLDSDVPYPYIKIRDNLGQVFGPKPKMEWIKDMQEVDDTLIDRLVNKSRAAAWFVSHCVTRSYRLEYVTKLQQALAKYRHTVDVYGKCGDMKCPREEQDNCNVLLNRDYYFYMSMENSFAEDYVTEKLLTALKQDVVPIVYGGADYSRFLPPGSYIDSKKYKPEELAALMNELIHSPRTYTDYFKWKYHYKYHDPSRTDNVCDVCKALNNEDMVKKVSVYKHFREWWFPNYKTDERC